MQGNNELIETASDKNVNLSFVFLKFNTEYHGHGGEMRIERPPYKGMGDILVQAAEDMGYNKTDLNAPFEEGTLEIVYFKRRI